MLEDAYLQGSSAWQQSGFGLHSSRDAGAWSALRRPVADGLLAELSSEQRGQPVHFLDTGCANGYLLECCVAWARAGGVTLIPWGLDLSEKLVALARERLPAYAQQVFVGNTWTWTPPRRFDAVRTELVYVPGPLRRRYVERLFTTYLAEDGLLLAAEYAGHTPDGEVSTLTIDETLRGWGYAVCSTHSGVLEGAERTRIAVVRRR